MPSQDLKKVILTPNRTERYEFTYGGGAFRFETHKVPVSTERLYKEVSIQTSLFVDGANAGIPDKILFQLTDIFRWDIDFALDIRQGDRFALVYEVQEVEGDVVGYGDIQVAQFINNGRVFEALRYDTQKRTDYFTVDGLSLRKAFIRTPVDFTRISSPFNPHRLHPIFKTTRPHQGADYAAPTGTEVQSAGDGTLTFVGQMTGYGNTIIVDHGHGFSTLYAHLNGFAEQMIAGRDVRQGQVIAFVGETGWATGPHLHYEFRINGQHQDPETITIPNDSPMNQQELRTFLPYAQQTMQRFTQRHSPAFNQALSRLRR
nr:M23 family metallopeptidase [Marinomonas ostreistagni]